MRASFTPHAALGFDDVYTARRIPALDGVRGLAISLVLAYHAFFTFADFPLGSAASRIAELMRLWWNGVDLFFVLSGFLIGGILLDSKSSPRYYRAFYVRRAFRILPLYILLVAAYSAASPRIPPFGEPLPGWSYLLMLQNFFIAGTGAFGVAWLGTTWSLAVEEQFYLVAPMFVRKLEIRVLKAIVIVMIATAPIVRIALFYLWPKGYIAAMVLVFSRLDVLMFGVGLAILLRSPRAVAWLTDHFSKLAGLALILLCGLVLFTLRNWSLWTLQMVAIGYSTQALFFSTVILLTLLNPSGRIAKLFEFGPLRFLGVRAYGLYLFHVPFIYLTFSIAGYPSPRVSNVMEVLIALSAVVAATLAASLSWHFFEKPLIARGHRYRYDSLPSESDIATARELPAAPA